MSLALALAAALHAIVAALIPSPPQHGAPLPIAIAQVRIERVRPTPTPTSKPSRSVAAKPGPPAARAASEVARRAGAARPKPPELRPARPTRNVPVGAQGAGAGNAFGAGSVGRGGAGNGGGSSGTGSGSLAAPRACGYVEFSDPRGSHYDAAAGGYWVDVEMTVRFANGATQSLLLDYPWFYPNAAANPWSEQNLDDPGFPTRFQAPPPDKLATEPALVAYVIAHSTRDGLTLLRDCPPG